LVGHDAEVLLRLATGCIGPQRLHPFGPELLDRLACDRELRLTPEVDQLVRQVSPRPSAGCSPGRTTKDFSLYTLCAIDMVTAWVEFVRTGG
jgi:hypothetical protein